MRQRQTPTNMVVGFCRLEGKALIVYEYTEYTWEMSLERFGKKCEEPYGHIWKLKNI